MIGGMILLGFFLYWMIAKKIVGMVYAETQSIIKKRIAIAIFILIPTWDVILGFPIYLYLCKYESGIKIYKTVDNVEGFYVGENHYGGSILLPYKGYRFIDYKEPKNGKYYRNTWLDTNTSAECISYDGAYSYDYTQAFRQGKCITNKELKESEVSRWKVVEDDINSELVAVLHLHKIISIRIIDKQEQLEIAHTDDYLFGKGWVSGIISSLETGNRSWASCLDHDFSYENNLLRKTLIPVGGK
ncbi:MAG: hypothetical protein PHQ22_10630 [Sulfuricurvum sp.]|nr:hypothetical protein [Sulfuricurvum sp.]